MTQFYDKFVVGMANEDDDVVKNFDSQDFASINGHSHPTDDYILYVHGYNIADWEKDRWTETMFKRLYWQGYSGWVGSFQWPTLEVIPSNILNDEAGYFLNYNQSEYRAYQAGKVLANRMERLVNEGKKVHILAHSQGNIVVGQALKDYNDNFGKITSYIATQAAIPVHAHSNEGLEMDGESYGEHTTPNLFGFFWSGTSEDQPYLHGVLDKIEPDKTFNYFNAGDWALDWWKTNNKEFRILGGGGALQLFGKPDVRKGYEYIGGPNRFNPPPPWFFSLDEEYFDLAGYDYFLHLGRILNIGEEDDLFKILAYCVKSRSNPLGAEARPVNGFESVNLSLIDAKFDGEHYAHSKQFRSNIAYEWGYWKRVVDDFLGRNKNSNE